MEDDDQDQTYKENMENVCMEVHDDLHHCMTCDDYNQSGQTRMSV